MDKKFINEILSIVYNSDLKLIKTKIRSLVINNDGSNCSGEIETDCLVSQNTNPLSSSFIAINMLLFSLYDGWLEEKYDLKEGYSFYSHYNDLQNKANTTNLEKIQNSCFRVMKIIRNGIIHNLSGINFSQNVCYIEYKNKKGIEISCNISQTGLSFLYSLIVIFVTGDCGIQTEGHFGYVVSTLYAQILKEVSNVKDEFGEDLISVSVAKSFYYTVRYEVSNCLVQSKSDYLIIKCFQDYPEMNQGHDYKIFYNGGTYLLPGEIISVSGDGNYKVSKKLLSELWKLKSVNEESVF